jgi:hypothetical protein
VTMDGTTDDTAAWNSYFNHIRATSRKAFAPEGTSYCASTLYLGGITFVGQGGPDNPDLSFLSLTRFLSDGSPTYTNGTSSTSVGFTHNTRIQDMSFSAAGGTVTAIETWESASYAYQICGWHGRGPSAIQTIADDAEAETTGGMGGITLRNVSIANFGGWGIYGYKWWGKSVLDDVFFRDCGQVAAAALGNLYGGAISLQSITVDCRFLNVHCYGDGTGTGIRLGSPQADSDAQGRLFDVGSNTAFSGCHFEGFKHPVALFNSKYGTFESCVFKGPSDNSGVMYLGYGPSSEANTYFSGGQNKLFGIASVELTHSGMALGNLYNQGPTDCEIKFWGYVKLDCPGEVSGSSYHKFILSPQGDLTDMLGGGAGSRSSTSIIPYIETNLKPSSLFQNRLPVFGAGSGGALAGWVKEGANGVAVSTETWSMRIRNSSGDGIAYYDVTGLVAGDVFTVMAWWDLTATTNNLEDLLYVIKDGSGVELLRRNVGVGAGGGSIHYRAWNVKVPAGETTIRVQFESESTNNAQVVCPIFVKGTHLQLDPTTYPNIWLSKAAVIVTS